LQAKPHFGQCFKCQRALGDPNYRRNFQPRPLQIHKDLPETSLVGQRHEGQLQCTGFECPGRLGCTYMYVVPNARFLPVLLGYTPAGASFRAAMTMTTSERLNGGCFHINLTWRETGQLHGDNVSSHLSASTSHRTQSSRDRKGDYATPSRISRIKLPLRNQKQCIITLCNYAIKSWSDC
jgi:hypothetical protein